MKIDYDKFSELCAAYVLGSLGDIEMEELAGMLKDADSKMLEIYSGFARIAFHLISSSDKSEVPGYIKNSILNKIKGIEPGVEQPRAKGASPNSFSYLFKDEGKWVNHPVKGIKVKLLSENREKNYGVMIFDVEPGVVFPPHFHSGQEDCLVLEGDLEVGGRYLTAGDFHLANAGSRHGELTTKTGCRLLIIASLDDYYPS